MTQVRGFFLCLGPCDLHELLFPLGHRHVFHLGNRRRGLLACGLGLGLRLGLRLGFRRGLAWFGGLAVNGIGFPTTNDRRLKPTQGPSASARSTSGCPASAL